MHLFLQGAPQVGKSTLLRQALQLYRQQLAGLLVQRLFEGDAVCGYRACVVSGQLPPVDVPYTPELDGIFILHRQPVPHVLVEAISRARQFVLKPACRLVVLDEIGGVELLSSDFMEPLQAILTMGKPCTGVLKARENLIGTAKRLQLPADILPHWEGLWQTIAGSGQVLDMTPENRQQVRRQVDAYLLEQSRSWT